MQLSLCSAMVWGSTRNSWRWKTWRASPIFLQAQHMVLTPLERKPPKLAAGQPSRGCFSFSPIQYPILRITRWRLDTMFFISKIAHSRGFLLDYCEFKWFWSNWSGTCCTNESIFWGKWTISKRPCRQFICAFLFHVQSFSSDTKAMCAAWRDYLPDRGSY